MERILKHFVRPLSESREAKIGCISEDDLEYLRSIGEYMYQKRSDKREALNSLNVGLKTASRRSELCSEIQRASQDRLANHTTLYAEVDTSNFNEEEIGGLINNSSSWMSNILSGTTDGHLLEKQGARAVGECPFESENTLLFMPILEKWLNSYISQSKHSIAITEFLHSVKDAIQMDGNIQEVIAKHSPENQGKVTYAK